MKNLRIKITREMTVDSRLMSQSDCPLARGIRSRFPNKFLSVGGFEATANGTRYTISQKEDKSYLRKIGALIDSDMDYIIITLIAPAE
jgi:hypothetical protein